jgi:hypothetical protein
MKVLPKIMGIYEPANGKLNMRSSGSINATIALRLDHSAKLCFYRRNGDPTDEWLPDQLPSDRNSSSGIYNLRISG